MSDHTTDPEIAALIPTDPLMAWPWASAVEAAIGDERMLAQFRADTGNQWTPGRVPLDRMIDEATGADRAFIIAFIRWFNDTYWGDLNMVAGK